MYFFRDELEKQAVLTPSSALKAMNNTRPGFLGNVIRGAGRAGAKAQEAVAKATPAAQNIAQGAYLGEDVALGTLKGFLGRGALSKVPAPTKIPAKVTDKIKSGLTWESRNSPLETTYNPLDLGNFIPTPSL